MRGGDQNLVHSETPQRNMLIYSANPKLTGILEFKTGIFNGNGAEIKESSVNYLLLLMLFLTTVWL